MTPHSKPRLTPAQQILALTPILEEAAQEIGQLTGPQRVAFAIQLIRDIQDPSCVGGLNRLGTLATELSHELLREQFGLRSS